MTKRLQKLLVSITAVAALGASAAVLAQAKTPTHKATHHAVKAAADGDTVQSGDQTTPDIAGSAAEPAGSAESQATAESAPSNDGPGGHADEPGNAAADHQFQGNE